MCRQQLEQAGDPKLVACIQGQESGWRRAFSILLQRHREGLLRFFGELSLEQIAHTLDIGLSAAKMRLYRAQEQFAAVYTRIPTGG